MLNNFNLNLNKHAVKRKIEADRRKAKYKNTKSED
jgi:hypothetical protein